MAFRVRRQGLIFHPAEIRSEVGRATDAIKLEIGKFGYRWIHGYLRTRLRRPTGFYQSRVIVDASTRNLALTDQGVIYGPWLEGVSSRNNATRFKGYFAFRKAGDAMDANATRIAETVLRPYLRRFG